MFCLCVSKYTEGVPHTHGGQRKALNSWNCSFRQWKPSCGFWELNPGSLPEQQVLLNPDSYSNLPHQWPFFCVFPKGLSHSSSVTDLTRVAHHDQGKVACPACSVVRGELPVEWLKAEGQPGKAALYSFLPCAP